MVDKMSKKKLVTVILLITNIYILSDIYNMVLKKQEYSQIHERLDSSEFNINMDKLSKDYPDSTITKAIRSLVELNSSKICISDLEYIPDKEGIFDQEMYDCEPLKKYFTLMERGNYVFFKNDIMEISYFIDDTAQNGKNCCVIITYKNDKILEKQFEGDSIVSITYAPEE